MDENTHWFVVWHQWEYFGSHMKNRKRTHTIIAVNKLRQKSLDSLRKFKKSRYFLYKYGDRVTLETDDSLLKKYKIDYNKFSTEKK